MGDVHGMADSAQLGDPSANAILVGGVGHAAGHQSDNALAPPGLQRLQA